MSRVRAHYDKQMFSQTAANSCNRFDSRLRDNDFLLFIFFPLVIHLARRKNSMCNTWVVMAHNFFVLTISLRITRSVTWCHEAEPDDCVLLQESAAPPFQDAHLKSVQFCKLASPNL